MFTSLPRDLKDTAEESNAKKQSWIHTNRETLLVPHNPAWSSIKARIIGHHVIICGNAMLRLEGNAAYATPPFTIKVGGISVSVNQAEHSNVTGGAFDVTYVNRLGVRCAITRAASNWFALTIGAKSFEEVNPEDVRGVSRQHFSLQKVANLTLNEEMNNMFQISDLGSKNKTEVRLEPHHPDSKFLFPFNASFTIAPFMTSTPATTTTSSSAHNTKLQRQQHQYYYCTILPPKGQGEETTSTIEEKEDGDDNSDAVTSQDNSDMQVLT